MKLIENMITKAINERKELNKEMHQRGIQVQFLYAHGLFSTYKFIMNGRESEVPFMNAVIKKRVEEVIKELTK